MRLATLLLVLLPVTAYAQTGPINQSMTMTGTYASNYQFNKWTAIDNTNTAGIASILRLENLVGGSQKAGGVSIGFVSNSIQTGAYANGAVVGAGFLGSIGPGLTGGGATTAVAITASAGATSFTADDAGVLEDDFSIWIALDNGTPFVPRVNSIVGNLVYLDRAFPSTASAGSTVMRARGRYKGLITNGASNAGSTSLLIVAGGEASVSARAGSSQAIKCIYCATQNFDDAARGLFFDMGIGVSAQSGAPVKLDSAFQVSDFAGQMPLGPESTVLKSAGAGTILHGINLTSLTITDDFARWGKTGMRITGGGMAYLAGTSLKAGPAPAAPASGWTLFAAPDGGLRAIAATGTIVTLGMP